MQREVWAAAATASLLPGTASHSTLVLAHGEQGLLNAAAVFAQKVRQQLPHGTNVSQNTVFRKAKGCSANSLMFRKSIETAWTLKPY